MVGGASGYQTRRFLPGFGDHTSMVQLVLYSEVLQWTFTVKVGILIHGQVEHVIAVLHVLSRGPRSVSECLQWTFYSERLQWGLTMTFMVMSIKWYTNKSYGSEWIVMVSRNLQLHAIGGNGVCWLCMSHNPNIWSHVLEYLRGYCYRGLTPGHLIRSHVWSRRRDLQ